MAHVAMALSRLAVPIPIPITVSVSVPACHGRPRPTGPSGAPSAVISAAAHTIRAMAPHAATATAAVVRNPAAHPAATASAVVAATAPSAVATAPSAPSVSATSTVHGESDPEFALGEWETEVSEEWYGCQGEDGDYEVSQSHLHVFLL